MFGGSLNKRTCPVGVDIGSRSVKLLQLERTATGFKAIAAAEADLPEGLSTLSDNYHHAVAEALAHAKSSGKFVGTQAVSCLPAEVVQHKNLRLPKMPAKDLAAAVQWEAQERLHLSAQPHSVQFFDAGEVRQGDEERQEIILMAAPTSFIESHVKTLTDCGFTPTAVDVAPGAINRCFEGTPPLKDGEARVTLDVGDTTTKVLIVRQDRIVFYKLIDIGGRHFDEAAARKLNMPRTEVSALRQQMRAGQSVQAHEQQAVLEAARAAVSDLGREVGLCLRYYSVTFRGRRPESAGLIGVEAGQPWLEDLLTEQAGVTMHSVNPMPHVDCAAVESVIPAGCSAAWATAAGLSMRQKQAAATHSSKAVAA